MTSVGADSPAARPRAVIHLSLGSNLGDREKTIRNAILAVQPRVEVTAISSIYTTAPVGYADQPEFLNACVEGRTELSPYELLAFLKDIERDAGRTPSFRNGPRTLDIDILLYAPDGDQMTLASEDLTIPHPRMHERAFVLAPLAELAPDLIHPVQGKTMRSLLAATKPEGVELWQGRG